jgi:cell division protein FtsN
VRTSLKSNLEKEYQGVMVFIAGHKNRAEAVRSASKLASNGITDHIIVNSPEKPNILSLGVFGLKRNADRLRARVEKLGFKVETESRYRERTIYWLYAEQSSETDVLQLLDTTDNESGISQIPTRCLPV